MGARKRISAGIRKEAVKDRTRAVLRNVPTSPRKMRLVTDMIRGQEVNRALDILKFSTKESSRRVEKLLLSAIANWQAKNEGSRLEDNNLYVQEVQVDGGRILRRIQTAPQGRAYRIRKRSNHITLELGSRKQEVEKISE
jgi:large subunit ribosomal protein L22